MSETSEPTTERKLTALDVLALAGMAIAGAIFLGALFIGMSIDPRIDLHGRLVAYTTALGGFAATVGCRTALSTTRVERVIFGAMAVVTALGAIAYGLVML